ncbi:DUF2207 domain-containing protein [Paratractidigestivibacter sp.]|uniref:DUF2207 domain-containing protein n=1 Tax=Paratractidigestivibacter sp. TaxID=2847316 RepID=UPI002ABE592C|nr:DUF2207 domain-containing protein [Paratractidigestivibacter sp.]
MVSRLRTFRSCGLWLSLVAAVVLALAAAPAVALAREYSITKVDIDATVAEDGTLRVEESRTFDFDGGFHGVYWKIPTGYNSSNGKSVDVAVVSAGEGSGSQATPFTKDDTGSESDGTYTVTDNSGYTELKIYSAHEDESATFTIVYEATGIVTRWKDTGELYWKFVSDGWDVESQNVTCTLHLPVAAGESVSAGDNVRAWGHGPLDASVSFAGDDVVFSVPGVGTSQYAEMRVMFPTSWISACEESSISKASIILSQEQKWADEANERRAAARRNQALAVGVPAVIAAGSAAITAGTRRRYKVLSAPEFQDEYFRDVPADEHPAVLGALYRTDLPDANELTATLMNLTDRGYIRLDKIVTTRRGVLGEKTKSDYQVTKLKNITKVSPEARRAGDSLAIDFEVSRFLFDTVALKNDEPGDTVRLSEFRKVAKSNPSDYMRGWNAWALMASKRYEDRFAKGAGSARGKGALIALGVVDCIVALVALFFLLFLDASILMTIAMPVALLAVGVFAIGCGAEMKKLNRDGIETKAKLEALRRWLLEFTKLDEAVPTDVVLWNRLLTMAVVLGVSKEVIKQLEVAAPELLNDPCFMPYYGWCYYGDGRPEPPCDAFSSGMAAAHEVSSAALAASSDSTGGGGGGGFSDGGGGGFGGGGGGGAF